MRQMRKHLAWVLLSVGATYALGISTARSRDDFTVTITEPEVSFDSLRTALEGEWGISSRLVVQGQPWARVVCNPAVDSDTDGALDAALGGLQLAIPAGWSGSMQLSRLELDFTMCREDSAIQVKAAAQDPAAPAAGSSTAALHVIATDVRMVNATSAQGALQIRMPMLRVAMQLQNVTFDSCEAGYNPEQFPMDLQDWAAHALYVEAASGSSLTLDSCSFTKNGAQHPPQFAAVATAAMRCRPGLSDAGCSVAVHSTSFKGNAASLAAALFFECSGPSCSLSLTNSTFSSNLMLSQALPTAASGNPFIPQAASVYFYSGPAESSSTGVHNITVHNTTWDGEVGGAGVRVYAAQVSADVELIDATFSNIFSTEHNTPGAGFQGVRTVVLSRCTFTNNSAPAAWGGVLDVINYPQATATPTAAPFPSVTISHSLFEGNTVEGVAPALFASAVYLVNAGAVTVHNSTFAHNTGYQGGALRLAKAFTTFPSTLTIAGSTFHNCTSAGRMAGAVYAQQQDAVVIGSSTFTGNRASAAGDPESTHGGAVNVIFCPLLEVHDSQFDANEAASAGGAMFLEEVSQALIHSVTFTSNKATSGNGGGALALAKKSMVNMINCTFKNNWGGKGRTYGGAVQVLGTSSFTVGRTSFEGNTAGVGGAIAAIGGSELEIDLPWFVASRGDSDFPVKWPEQFARYAAAQGELRPSCVFEANAAYSGGAVAVTDARLFTGLTWPLGEGEVAADTLFFNNRALTGGAMTALRNTNGMYLARARFENNTALMDDAVLLADMAAPALQMGASQEWIDAQVQDAAVANGCGPGNGGALCVSCTSNCNDERQLIELVALANNTANYGGGLYVGASREQCVKADGCYRLLITGASMSTTSGWVEDPLPGNGLVPGSETVMAGNTAVGGAGGAIYMENLGIVRILCPEYDTGANESILGHGLQEPGTSLPCASWSGNSATGGGFGPTLASTPARFTAAHVQPDAAASYTSSVHLPLSIRLFDAFGQMHAPAVVNSVEAGATSVVVNDTDTTGQRAVRAGGREAVGFAQNFTELALYAVPGPRSLQLLGEVAWVRRTLTPQMVNLTVRACVLNEFSSNEGKLCSWCEVGYFNLDPSSPVCSPCPDDATCVVNTTRFAVDNGVIVPHDGFYHSSAFSDQLHECAYSNGCVYEGRAETLTAYQARLIPLPELYRASEYAQMQCAPGYEGPLCGACSSGYGLKRDQCLKCMKNTHLNTLYYVLITFVGVISLIITAKAAMSNATELMNQAAVDAATEEDGAAITLAAGPAAHHDSLQTKARVDSHDDAKLVLPHPGPPTAAPPLLTQHHLPPSSTSSPLHAAGEGHAGPFVSHTASVDHAPAAPTVHAPAPASKQHTAVAAAGQVMAGTSLGAPTNTSITSSLASPMAMHLPTHGVRPNPWAQHQPHPLSQPHPHQLAEETGTHAVADAHIEAGPGNARGPLSAVGSQRVSPINHGASVWSLSQLSMRSSRLSGPGPLKKPPIDDPSGNQDGEGLEQGEQHRPNAGPYLKILISYLQVLSIIRFVPLPDVTPAAYTRLLQAYNTMVSAPEAEVILECSMPDNGVPRQVSVAIVHIAIPFCAWAFVTALWLVAKALAPGVRALRTRIASWRQGRRPTKSATHAAVADAAVSVQIAAAPLDAAEAEAAAGVDGSTRAVCVVVGHEGASGGSVPAVGGLEQHSSSDETGLDEPQLIPLSYGATLMIITITTIFFYYENLVEHILRIFDCDKVDAMQPGKEPHPLAAAAGMVLNSRWRADYRMACYEGQHGVLTWALGIPGLVLFALACPVATAWWLFVHLDVLDQPWFAWAWGFLYEEYRRGAFYWESVVMLRKLALACVLVFLSSSDTPQGVQVLAAVACVSIALAVHVYTRPHALLKLSHLESLSLVVTVLTLYLSLFYTYDIVFPHNYVTVGAMITIINVAACVILGWFVYIELLDTVVYKAGLLNPDGSMKPCDRASVAAKLRPKLGMLAQPTAWAVMQAQVIRNTSMTYMATAQRTAQRSASEIKRRVLLRTASGHTRSQVRRATSQGLGSLYGGSRTYTSTQISLRLRESYGGQTPGSHVKLRESVGGQVPSLRPTRESEAVQRPAAGGGGRGESSAPSQGQDGHASGDGSTSSE